MTDLLPEDRQRDDELRFTAESQLGRLLLRRDRPEIRELWMALPSTLRSEAAAAYLVANGDQQALTECREILVRSLRGFRPGIVRRWPPGEVARRISRIRLEDDDSAESMLIALFLGPRVRLQQSFFDALNVDHDDGIPRGTLAEPADSPMAITAAARALMGSEPAALDAAIYLVALDVLKPRTWPGLIEIVRRVLTGQESERAEPVAPDLAPEHDPESEETDDAELLARVPRPRRAKGSVPPGTGPDELQELDHLLIAAIVDSRAGGATAPSDEAVDASLEQLLHLAPRRHTSYFHIGFRDALVKRPAAESLEVANEQRWRWYYSGYISALAREARHSDVVQLFDNTPIVRSLGDGLAPGPLVALHIVQALAEEQRHASAGGFVRELALVKDNGPLAARMLSIASDLMREERVPEARAYLAVLSPGLARRRTEGHEVPAGVWADVRRRLAHCFRHENNFAASTELLEEILQDRDLDPGHKAMVLSDLGLMAAGFSRLADIRLPEREAEIGACLDLLDRGAVKFREAFAETAQESAHGCYPLGIIALLEQEFSEAFRLLEQAVARFDRARDRYTQGGLLVRARFAAALAGVVDERNGARVPALSEWILDGLKAGERIPAPLVEHVVTGIALSSEELATRVTTALLACQEHTALEALAAVSLPGSARVIAAALLERARDVRRPITARIGDLQRALRLFKMGEQGEGAESVLDEMQGLAHQNCGRGEFESMLRDQQRTIGVWDASEVADALAALLEAQGRYESAADVLAQEFHRILSGDGFDCLTEAEGLLERVQGYGESAAAVASQLRARLDGARSHVSPPIQTPVRPRSVSVLVVGGDERQEAYDERLEDHFVSNGSEIRVQFMHTGWGSNWGGFVSEFDRRKGSADGVVIMRFIRTELGRTIRRHWTGAQLGCWGHGFDSLRRAIEEVAAQARRKR